MRRFRLSHLVVAMMCTILLIALAPSVAARTVYVKWDSPGSGSPATYDGLSWGTAFHGVQEGVNAAVSGDEVWVAAGTYPQSITISKGVALYGGFLGCETERSQRDPDANSTFLQTSRCPVIDIRSVNIGNSVIDGFTIHNSRSYGSAIRSKDSRVTVANNLIANCGDGGTGTVHCTGGSAVIQDNIIRDNPGIGIYCVASWDQFTISHNTITRNAEGGISVLWGGAAIRDNVITHNGNDGICVTYDPTEPGALTLVANNDISENLGNGYSGNIGGLDLTNNIFHANGAAGISSDSIRLAANNTITGNRIGVSVAQFGGKLANNIIAYNGCGVYSKMQLELVRNCVYGNEQYDYSAGLQPGRDDIRLDPKLASVSCGELHIQPNSPCRNAGDNSVAEAGWKDMDRQDRITASDNKLDVGADESDGTPYAVTTAIIRVTSTGSDANDGSAWDDAHAMKTVQAAADIARERGAEIWVKAGTYTENITLRPHTYLYGGFTGTETGRDQRDWKASTSVLDGNAMGTVVSIRGGFRLSTLDGFTVRNGVTSDGYSGGGIDIANSSPTIANNTVTANSNSGISIRGLAIPMSSDPDDGFIPVIIDNTISGNSASAQGAGIDCQHSRAVITHNAITDNAADHSGGGICSVGCNPRIANNLIARNTSANYGGGIAFGESEQFEGCIINNTIVANTAGDNGGGLSYNGSWRNQTPVFAVTGNIVAFNSSGVWLGGTKEPRFTHNDVFGNPEYDYREFVAQPTGIDGNISADPMFVDQAGGNYHLTSASPCINAGLNSVFGLTLFDFDGEGRICRGIVDMGADEYWSPTLNGNDIRNAPDDAVITGNGMVATALFRGSFYAEAENRSSGIRVDKAVYDIEENSKVVITGRVKTDANGEKYIAADTAAGDGAGNVKPLMTVGRSLSEGGISTLGLLVTLIGKVDYADTDYLWVDDSSAPNDGSGHKGVKVLATGRTFPSTGMVKVTGIITLEKNEAGTPVRVLKVRGQRDIVPL